MQSDFFDSLEGLHVHPKRVCIILHLCGNPRIRYFMLCDTAENKLTEWLEGRVSAILNGQYMLAGHLDTEQRCAVVFMDKA